MILHSQNIIISNLALSAVLHGWCLRLVLRVLFFRYDCFGKRNRYPSYPASFDRSKRIGYLALFIGVILFLSMLLIPSIRTAVLQHRLGSAICQHTTVSGSYSVSSGSCYRMIVFFPNNSSTIQ
jgi:hypothetical protein